MSQYNSLPQYNVPLMVSGLTAKGWYFYFTGLYKGLPPANVSEVTLSGSPFTYTAEAKGFLLITGGTVSAVAFSRDGVTFYPTGQTAGQFTLNAADQLRITYSVAPTAVFVPT